MNMNVLIPAVPRSELHETTIIKLMRVLVGSDINVRVFINFDVPPFLEEKNYSKTLNALQSIVGVDNVFFHVNDVDPCFTRAFLKVFDMSDKHGLKEGYYFWLEDDWELVDKESFLDKLKLLETCDTLCIVNGGPAGPPFIFNGKFFEMIRQVAGKFEISAFKLKEYDPEPFFQSVYTKFSKDIKNVRVGGRPDEKNSGSSILLDRGRDWREERKIRKWGSKTSGGRKTWGK